MLLTPKRAFDGALDLVPTVPREPHSPLSASGNADNLRGILDMTTEKPTLDASFIATAPALIMITGLELSLKLSLCLRQMLFNLYQLIARNLQLLPLLFAIQHS